MASLVMLEVNSPTGTYIAISLVENDVLNTTYVCKKRDSTDRFTMKVCHRKDRFGSSVEDKIKTEIRIIQNIKHAAIIGFVESFAWNDRIVIISDYFSSETIGRLMQTAGPLNEDRVQKVALQLIDVVGYMHSLGIAYSNFNGNTVLIDENNNIKLYDFMNARPVSQPIPRHLFMTPPPEVLLESKPETVFSEVFAIGVLLYYLVTNLQPWVSPYDPDLAAEICERPLVRRGAMSLECHSFLVGMMDPSIRKRYSINQARSHIWISSGMNQRLRATSRSTVGPLRHMREIAASTRHKSMVYQDTALVDAIRQPCTIRETARDQHTSKKSTDVTDAASIIYGTKKYSAFAEKRRKTLTFL